MCKAFLLATSVNLELFAVELEAFAYAVGAGPTKQIVLVLDRAGWHASGKLRVPEHVHLLFLPAFSSDLQPAEHLWPLTNTALVNRHLATIKELEETQLARCAALQRRLDLIRSTTRLPLVARDASGNDKAQDAKCSTLVRYLVRPQWRDERPRYQHARVPGLRR
jgi:transposase